MSEHREAAIEAARLKLKGLGWVEAWDQDDIRADLALALDAARPHERAAWREELLSEEAVWAVAAELANEHGEQLRGKDVYYRNRAENLLTNLRAAFDAIGEDK